MMTRLIVLSLLLATYVHAQVTGPNRIPVNKTVALTVTPKGGTPPYTYQWYKDDVAIAGQTSDRLILSPLVVEQGGLYHIVVSNEAGSVSSDKAPITPVKSADKPTITVTVTTGTISSVGKVGTVNP